MSIVGAAGQVAVGLTRVTARPEVGASVLPRAEVPLLRNVIGARLRGERLSQERTLREVSREARVSLGYLSEVERGQKEASSELLTAICGALQVRLSELLSGVSADLDRAELAQVARLATRSSVAGRPLGLPSGTTVDRAA